MTEEDFVKSYEISVSDNSYGWVKMPDCLTNGMSGAVNSRLQKGSLTIHELYQILIDNSPHGRNTRTPSGDKAKIEAALESFDRAFTEGTEVVNLPDTVIQTIRECLQQMIGEKA